MPKMSCAICLILYKSADEVCATSCGHIFHRSCMQEWQTRSTNCPQCRMDNPQLYKLHLEVDEEGDKALLEVQTKLEQSNQKSREFELRLEQAKADFNNKFTGLQEELQQKTKDSESLELVLALSKAKENELKAKLEQSAKNKSDLELRLEHSEADSTKKLTDLSTKFEQKIRKTSELQLCLQKCEDDLKQLQQQNIQKDLEIGALNEEIVFLTAIYEAGVEEEKRTSQCSGETEMEVKLKQELAILENNLKQITWTVQKSIKNSESTVGKMQNILGQCKTDTTHGDENMPPLKLATTASKSVHPPMPQHGESLPAVLISGLKHTVTQISFVSVVLQLAKRMEIDCCRDDIVNTFILDGRDYQQYNVKPGSYTIVVQFKSLETKAKFLMGKEKLEKNPQTSFIVLQDFVSRKANVLYDYAKNLRSCGYRYVYCNKSMVLAREWKNSPPIRITNMKQVDMIMEGRMRGKQTNKDNGATTIQTDIFSDECSDFVLESLK